MYISENRKKEIIFADQADSRLENGFRCPGCKKPVFLKKGTKNHPHFSHYARQACETFSEGETIEHLKGKKQLYNWFKVSNQEIKMEAYLSELKQRPDLFWIDNFGKKIAIEFQCSSLSCERMVERTQGYLAHGYKVLWILGDNFQLNDKITVFQKRFMMSFEENLIVYMQYSADNQELHIHSHFQVTEGSDVSFEKKILRPSDYLFTTLDHLVKSANYPKKKNREKDYRKIHLDLLRMSHHRSPTVRRFFRLIYENKEDLVSMPIEVYRTVPHEWLIATYSFEWKFSCLKWVESYPPKRMITMKMIRAWIEKSTKEHTLSFYTMPLIKEILLLEPIIEFLDLLTNSNILKKYEKNKWIVLKKAKRFNHIQEKEQLLKYN